MKTTLLYLAPMLIAAVAALAAVLPVSAEVAPTQQSDPGGCDGSSADGAH